MRPMFCIGQSDEGGKRIFSIPGAGMTLRIIEGQADMANRRLLAVAGE